MFATVRHWWTGGRGKVTGRLFLFEFFVVVLGVLVAQWVADWADERAAKERLATATARLDRDIENNLHAATAWQMAMPCFQDRIGTIMRLAANGEEVPSDLLVRPALRLFQQQTLSEEDDLLLRRTGGEERANTYSQFEDARVSAMDAGTDLANHWLALAVLDPVYGPVDEGDRTNARHDAAQMLSALRRLDILSRYLLLLGKDLDLKAIPEKDARSAKDCAEIWQRADMTPDPRQDP